MSEPYYPPRARWYSPVLHLGGTLRRALHLDRLGFVSDPGLAGTLAGLLLPGYAFAIYGRQTIARAVAGGYLLAAAVFIVWLGHSLAMLALSAMIALHVVSVLHLVGRQSNQLALRWKMALSLAVFSAVYFAMYRPFQRQFERWVAMPLRVGNKVVMVRARQSAGTIKRGDWVAYRIGHASGDHVYLEDGFGLGRVEAAGGDQIVFGRANYQVNGTPHPRRAFMPADGTWVVPEKHWFIWPESAISIPGRAGQNDAIAQLIRETAMVSEAQYAGIPLGRWLWWRQEPP